MTHISLALLPHYYLHAQGSPARTDLVNPRVGHPFGLVECSFLYIMQSDTICKSSFEAFCHSLGAVFLPSSLSLFSSIRAVHYSSLLVQIILVLHLLILCQLDYWCNPLFIHPINHLLSSLHSSVPHNDSIFSKTLSLEYCYHLNLMI